jgi:ATP-dependent Clp protease protease subunit
MHQLQQLLALNKGKGSFYVENKNETDATIYLYDAIVSDSFFGGVSAIDFVKELNALTQPIIHLRINSPGGDVFAARAMSQAIKEHPSKIIAHVDGVAASAATFPVIAADESVISNGGMFMIHNAWTFGAGNASDFLELADLLEKTDQSILNDYVAKTNKPSDEIKAMMDAETYLYGQEAVDAGFIGAIAEATVKNTIKWDLSAYLHAPIIEDKQTEPEPEPEKIEEFDFSDLYRSLNLKRIAV